MPQYIEVLLPIYITIFIIALIGNTFFLVAVIINKKLHKTVFIIIANQCLSDLLFNLLSVFDAFQYVTNDWTLGVVACRIQSTTIEVTYTVSGLSLCCAAVKRYWEICHECKVSKHRIRRCIMLCVGIWMASFLVSSPLFYANSVSIYTNTSFENVSIITRRCGTDRVVSLWVKKADFIYHCIQFSFIYILPLIILMYTSVKIIHKLKLNTRRKSQCLRRQKRSKEKRQIMLKENARNMKITKLLTTITICFFILWTPFVVIRIAQSVITVTEISFTICQLILFASTAPNFYITYAMCTEFKKTVRRMVRMRRSTVNCQMSPRQATIESVTALQKRGRSDTRERKSNVRLEVM